MEYTFTFATWGLVTLWCFIWSLLRMKFIKPDKKEPLIKRLFLDLDYDSMLNTPAKLWVGYTAITAFYLSWLLVGYLIIGK